MKELIATIKLSKIALIYSGFAFKSSELKTIDLENKNIGIPIIKIANIQNKKVLKECNDFLPKELFTNKLQKYLLKQDDILIAMTGAGSVGKIGKMRRPENDYLVNQRVAIVRVNSDIANSEYVYQVLTEDKYEQLLYGWGLGAGQPNVSSAQIGEVYLPLPPLPTQRRIAAILSTYDELIENNSRRIKILEEMARMIYQEWFVKFRFPGHEQAKFVESPLGMIPAGWEVKKLGDVVSLEYGKGLKADQRKPGKYLVYGSSGIVGFHNEYLVEKPGIIVGRKGNVGSVFWSDYNFFPIDTVFYVKTKISLKYVYFNLQTQNFINNDAAVPGLNRNQAYLLPFLVPETKLLACFELELEPIFTLLKNLRKHNELLKQTRDMLLPKLISGEIDVSDLDIPIESR